MPDDVAMDSQVPQAPEAGLPEEWREHVRELRAENARRRKENQELRAQLAALSERARAADAAQAAAADEARRDASRLAAVHRRLKEAEVARLAREALRDTVARRASGTPGTAGGGAPQPPVAVDLARAQRLLERVPAPVSLDADLTVDDEGRVALEPAAGDRLRGFVEELVDLLAVEPRVAPPPVGGEPPRPAPGEAEPIANSWDPDGQRSPAGKARASLRQAAASNAVVLEGLTQI